jgi:hypothetical protein
MRLRVGHVLLRNNVEIEQFFDETQPHRRHTEDFPLLILGKILKLRCRYRISSAKMHTDRHCRVEKYLPQ